MPPRAEERPTPKTQRAAAPRCRRGTRLVIVESPAKARTIAGYLGDGYLVESSIGHIRDLPRNAADVPAAVKGKPWARLGVDVDNGFEPLYIVTADKKAQVAKLKALLKDADELYLATDEDREGEAIAWHLLQTLKPRVPVRRMVFHEITPQAIRAGGGQPAGDRRAAGRRPGDAPHPRPALRLRGVPGAVEEGHAEALGGPGAERRDRASWSSASAPAWRSASAGYWDIEGLFTARLRREPAASRDAGRGRRRRGSPPDATSTRPASSPAERCATSTRRPPAPWSTVSTAPASRVTSVEERPYRRSPYAPFMTSTLQQEAGRKLRFSSQRTMQIAQRLYENGYITYMRTDSTALSETAIAAARTQARQLYGPEYVPDEPRTYTRKVKNAQEAHEAIRPAGDTFRTPGQLAGQLNGDEFRLYELIWQRTVASQMADATGTSATVRLAAPGRLRSGRGQRRDLPGLRQGHHLPRLPAGLRRRQRRPGRRARGPRAAPAAGARGRLASACAS